MANSKTSKVAVVACIDLEISGVFYPRGTYFSIDKTLCDKWEPKGYVQIVEGTPE